MREETGYTKAQLLYQSQEDTAFFFEHILKTRVPGTELSITSQQQEACDKFDFILNSKRQVLLNQKRKPEEKYKLSGAEKKIIKKVGVSVQSGKGTGKTTWLAGLALKFLWCYPNSLIVIGSNSIDQLKRTIWAEMGRLLSKSLIKDEIVLKSEKAYLAYPNIKDEQQKAQYHFISQIATNTGTASDQATTLGGLHADYMFVIVDEATGQENDAVFEQLITTLTKPVNLMVLAFNPNTDRGFAIDSHREKQHMFECLLWDSEKSELVSKETIERMEKTYGRDSNIFRTYVKGLVPVTASDALLPWSQIQEASKKEAHARINAPVVMGIDPSGGGDAVGFYVRQGDRGIASYEKSYATDEAIEHGIANEAIMYEVDKLAIEVDGLGGPIYNTLLTMSIGDIVTAFRTIRKASDNSDCLTERDEVCMKLKKKFADGVASIPDDPDLMNQLGFLKTDTDPKSGKIKIKGKKEFKSKYGRSPNKGDALIASYSVNDWSITNPKTDKKASSGYKEVNKKEVKNGQHSWLTN